MRCGLKADKKFVENVKEETETETKRERNDVNVDQSLISLRPTDLIWMTIALSFFFAFVRVYSSF